MGRVLGPDDANPRGIERPMPVDSTLTLSPRSLEVLEAWKHDAVVAAAGVTAVGTVEPLSSLVSCLTTLLRIGGTGYAKSDSLIVVGTTSGKTVGLHRDRKGVCSLNS